MTDVLTVVLPTVDARIYPRGGLDVLSRTEVARLRDASSGGMHELLRRCALAVLTSGSASDDPRAARELYPEFDIEVLQWDCGVDRLAQASNGMPCQWPENPPVKIKALSSQVACCKMTI